MGKEEGYLGRGIHDEKFLTSLEKGKLRSMLDVINNDKLLDVQIRNNYLNIYYRGGNIAKINSENSIEFDKFYFYLDMDKTPKNKIEKGEKVYLDLKKKKNELVSSFKDGDYEQYFDKSKRIMDKWLDKMAKEEREAQHKLSVNNQYGKSDYTIIDLEYQVSVLGEFKCEFPKENPKKPRFDIIAVDQYGNLCVIELKKGAKALRGTSGLVEHWQCYNASIGRNEQPFIKEMTKVLKQKQGFGLIDKAVVINSNKIKFLFAYIYDNEPKEYQDKVFKTEYDKIEQPIDVLIVKEDTYKLTNS